MPTTHLTAEPLTVGSPQIGTVIQPPLALSAEPLMTATPQIGTPAVGQIHVLRAEPLHTEPPEIVERRGVHRLHVQPSRRTRKSTAYMVDRCRTVLRERLWPERFPTREELPHRHYLKMAKHALKSDPRTRNLPLDRMRKTIMRAGYRER
jgi:hypothetical protein